MNQSAQTKASIDGALAIKLLCGGSVLSLILLALPFLKFTSENEYASQDTVVTGFQTLFGTSKSIAALILLLAPIAILASHYVAQLQPFRRTICILAPLLSALFSIITFIRVKAVLMDGVDSFSDYADYYCKPQIGMILLLLVSIGVAAIAFLNCPKSEKDLI